MAKNKTASAKQEKPNKLVLFFPLLTLTFILWVLYRTLFDFPVWFDETLGKALFFGLPVWMFVSLTGNKTVLDSFASYKLRSGLLLGLAIGGVFGFVGSLLSIYTRGGVVQAVALFDSPAFWRELLLALMTGFWETLLFFSFVMGVASTVFKKWSLLRLVVFTAGVFVLFHLPNIILRYSPGLIMGQAILLALFSIGQAYLFAARRNAYALILSHAIWGMVLLVHFW